MIRLFHHPLSVSSRFVRLILSECELIPQLVEERPWERREEFLIMNPAGTLPVLVEDQGPPAVGAWPVSEYLDETRGFALAEQRLLPPNADQRAEVRRLCEWFLVKFDSEVTFYLAEEKVIKRERANPQLLQASRKKRIAKGAGLEVSELNKLLKMQRQMGDMMKKMGKMGKGKMLKQAMSGMFGKGGGMPPGMDPSSMDPKALEQAAKAMGGKLPGLGGAGLPSGLSGFGKKK